MIASSTTAADHRKDHPPPHLDDYDSDANGYETDTIDDALHDDDDDAHGDESLATFSSAKTIHESADVVRVAAFPSPPFVEREDPTEVDWEAAMPAQWPADLDDLFANNPAGARTWSEVEAAMRRLVAYHEVRDTSHILSVVARRAPRVARAHHARSASPPPPLLADAAAASCLCNTKLGQRPSAQIVPGEYTAPLHSGPRVASGKRPPVSPLGSDSPPLPPLPPPWVG